MGRQSPEGSSVRGAGVQRGAQSSAPPARPRVLPLPSPSATYVKRTAYPGMVFFNPFAISAATILPISSRAARAQLSNAQIIQTPSSPLPATCTNEQHRMRAAAPGPAAFPSADTVITAPNAFGASLGELTPRQETTTSPIARMAVLSGARLALTLLDGNFISRMRFSGHRKRFCLRLLHRILLSNEWETHGFG